MLVSREAAAVEEHCGAGWTHMRAGQRLHAEAAKLTALAVAQEALHAVADEEAYAVFVRAFGPDRGDFFDLLRSSKHADMEAAEASEASGNSAPPVNAAETDRLSPPPMGEPVPVRRAQEVPGAPAAPSASSSPGATAAATTADATSVAPPAAVPDVARSPAIPGRSDFQPPDWKKTKTKGVVEMFGVTVEEKNREKADVLVREAIKAAESGDPEASTRYDKTFGRGVWKRKLYRQVFDRALAAIVPVPQEPPPPIVDATAEPSPSTALSILPGRVAASPTARVESAPVGPVRVPPATELPAAEVLAEVSIPGAGPEPARGDDEHAYAEAAPVLPRRSELSPIPSDPPPNTPEAPAPVAASVGEGPHDDGWRAGWGRRPSNRGDDTLVICFPFPARPPRPQPKAERPVVYTMGRASPAPR